MFERNTGRDTACYPAGPVDRVGSAAISVPSGQGALYSRLTLILVRHIAAIANGPGGLLAAPVAA